MQTKQPHTKQMDTEQTSFRAELWLREHSPGRHDRQQAALTQFHDLAQNGGHLDALSVHTWSKHIVPSEYSLETATAALDTIHEFEAWTDQNGQNLQPSFQLCKQSSLATEITQEIIVPPILCLAVYTDVTLREAEHGRLINISSVVDQAGNYGQANYAATKSGLFGFTRTIALELASEGTTANCVAPGFVKTDMLADVPDEVQENFLDCIPLDRFAEVEDIAGIVRFLADEDSEYMTGQILSVNGGMEW